MSATILLKRTLGTSPPNIAPVGTGVSFGELIYTYDTSDVGAGKSYKKLYIGNPAGPTAAPIPIGGEYYTSLFNDNPSDYGKPQASKVLILDSQGRVASWTVVDDFYTAGVGTVAGDFTVGGNLNVTGDLQYDEANARNWNITGVATANTLEASNILFSQGTITDLFAVTVVVTTLSGTAADYYEVNVGHALTANNLEVTGVGSFSNQVTFANDIVKIGRDTAVGLSSADGSIFIGDFAAAGMGQTTLNRRNIAIGASAMQYAGILSSSDELESNIVMGNFAGYRLQGTKNLMIGDKVGFALSSSGNDENIALGNQSMYGETFPVVDGVTLSVNVGDQTALANYDQTEDVTETSGSGQGLLVRIQTGATGLITNIEIIAPGDGYEVGDTFTMPFGFQTLTGSVTSKNGRFLSGGTGTRQQQRNIAIGPYTLFSVDGSKNIAIGYSAGNDTLGSGNVIIGYERNVAIGDSDNQLVIGNQNINWIDGNQLGYVGIGTTRPFGLLDVGGVVIVDKGTGNTVIAGVTSVPQIDADDIGVEDIKVTAGLATDFAITNAKIQSGIITDTVGTAATITNVDFVNADIEAAKITAGIITDIVGTAATITTFDTEVADLKDIKVTTGLVTSLVGTYATITTFDSNEGDINTLKTVAGVVTSLTGFGVTYNTADFEILDAKDVKVTTGLITSLVGTYVTFQDANFQDDVRVGGALTVVGDLTVNGTTSFVQSTVVQITDKNIELGITSGTPAANATADNGGIILKGTTDKTFLYDQPREAWESNLKFIPNTDGTLDLGTTDREWKDIYIDGTAHLDAADILDAKITAGVITSQVGTYATIGTVDIETLDAKDVNITGLAVTDVVGTAATIVTVDFDTADIVTATIGSGIVTDIQVSGAATVTGFVDLNDGLDVQGDFRVGGASTFVGNVTFEGGTIGLGNSNTDNIIFEGDVDSNILPDNDDTYDLGSATKEWRDIYIDGVARVDDLIVDSTVGTYATFTTAQVTNLSADNLTLTGLAVTDVVVATAATFTGVIDVNDADILNAKITAGVITSQVGTYATITTFDTETADLRDVKITAGIITDIVGTAATITTVDFEVADILNATVSVGIATSAFVQAGFITSLYDSTGVVGLNTQHILSTDPAGTITWREPAQIGIATINAKLDTWFVSTNGVDDGEPSRGRTPERPFRTIAYALSQISNIGVNDVLNIAAGVYEEVFPLTVPAGLTVKGAGLRATKIIPTTATKQKDCFLMNDRSVVEDVTIADMFFDTAGNQGYAFKFAPGIAITSRSPYVQRVTVFNKGSNTSTADPYGYGSADAAPSSYIAGGGAYIDGSEVAAGSLEAAFLFNEVTFIVPNSKGLIMTNGARTEYLNCFSYFAAEGIKGTSGSLGISSAGETRLRLTGITTVGVGNTITVFDTDGTTGLATAIVAGYDGTYLDVTGKQTGFEVLRARTAKTVTFNDNAQLDTTVKKFGSAALKLDGSNDSISIPSSGDLGFGTNTDFTIEFWAYANTTGLTSATLFDLRDNGTDAEGISVAFRAAGEVDMRVGTTTAITGSGAGIATGVWKHYALTRDGTDTRLFVDGTQRGIKTSDTTDYGASKGLVIGADFDGASQNVTGWIDDFRIERGVAKYTSNFTAPTAAHTGDKDTVLLLSFDGASGVTTTTDDVIRNQDIRITQAGGGIGTATKVILADYSQFGADMRSVGCAIEYGQKGVIADGDGVSLRLFALNFNHVGAGGDFSNDPNLAIQANEVTELNNGDVSFVSIDQRGDFRVGDAFFVDQESGTVSFSQQVTSLQALSSLQITDGTDSSVVTPTSGTFGNIQISGNNIESTSGDINIDPAGAGDINITGDVNVLGILTATTIQLDAFQKNDTSIALDDSGANGTIRFNTDNVEGMRLDANQKLGIGTASPRDRLDVLDTAQFERVNVTGLSTFGSNVDINASVNISTDLEVVGHSTFSSDIRVGTGATTEFLDDVHFGDNDELTFGYGKDLTISHDSTNSLIKNTTGLFVFQASDFKFKNEAGTEDLATFTENLGVDLYYNDLKKFETTGYGVSITGGLISQDLNIAGVATFNDNVKLHFGDDEDLSIYHDGNNSYIDDSGTGTLAIRSNQVELQKYTGETLANFTADGSVTLFWNNGKRFETISAGSSVSGELQTGTLDVATNANIHAALTVDHGTVLTGILTSSAGVEAININVSGILTTNNFRVTGVTTISNITIGAGSSSTKINTLSGELVLDSAAGQVVVEDDLNVVGYATVRDGLYYLQDTQTSTQIKTTSAQTTAGNRLFFDNLSGIQIGATVTGTNIPGGTTVDSVISVTEIQLSQAVSGVVAAGAAIQFSLTSATGIGYSGPNGIAYFENDGRLVSGLSTVGFLTTSNYMLTTDENNIPIWSDSIDGGTF